jgi:hypothetical protein
LDGTLNEYDVIEYAAIPVMIGAQDILAISSRAQPAAHLSGYFGGDLMRNVDRGAGLVLRITRSGRRGALRLKDYPQRLRAGGVEQPKSLTLGI